MFLVNNLLISNLLVCFKESFNNGTVDSGDNYPIQGATSEEDSDASYFAGELKSGVCELEKYLKSIHSLTVIVPILLLINHVVVYSELFTTME